MSANQLLLDQFRRCVAEGDMDVLVSLLHRDCEWLIVATGETFRGVSEARRLFDMAGKLRGQFASAVPEIKNAFAGDDHLCIEFVNRLTPHTASGAAAEPIEMDFCMTARVRDGKIHHVREYFDQAQFGTPPSKRNKLFS